MWNSGFDEAESLPTFLLIIDCPLYEAPYNFLTAHATTQLESWWRLSDELQSEGPYLVCRRWGGGSPRRGNDQLDFSSSSVHRIFLLHELTQQRTYRSMSQSTGVSSISDLLWMNCSYNYCKYLGGEPGLELPPIDVSFLSKNSWLLFSFSELQAISLEHQLRFSNIRAQFSSIWLMSSKWKKSIPLALNFNSEIVRMLSEMLEEEEESWWACLYPQAYDEKPETASSLESWKSMCCRGSCFRPSHHWMFLNRDFPNWGVAEAALTYGRLGERYVVEACSVWFLIHSPLNWPHGAGHSNILLTGYIGNGWEESESPESCRHAVSHTEYWPARYHSARHYPMSKFKWPNLDRWCVDADSWRCTLCLHCISSTVS